MSGQSRIAPLSDIIELYMTYVSNKQLDREIISQLNTMLIISQTLNQHQEYRQYVVITFYLWHHRSVVFWKYIFLAFLGFNRAMLKSKYAEIRFHIRQSNPAGGRFGYIWRYDQILVQLLLRLSIRCVGMHCTRHAEVALWCSYFQIMHDVYL